MRRLLLTLLLCLPHLALAQFGPPAYQVQNGIQTSPVSQGTSGSAVGLLNANKTDSGNNAFTGVNSMNTLTGCNKASPATGVAVDLTSCTGQGNSTMTTPQGSVVQRPVTPVNGMIRYNTDATWAAAGTAAYHGRHEEYVLGRTITGTSAAGWFDFQNSNDGAIDITAAPYYAPCNGNIDISNTVQNAINTGRSVYIPPTTNGCVFGGIVLSGANTLYGEHSLVKPAPGYGWVVELTGGGVVRGLNINETIATGQISNIVATTTLASGAAAGATSVSVNNLTGPSGTALTVTFTNDSALIGSGTNTLFSGEQVVLTTTGTLPTNFSPNVNYFVIATGLTTTQFELSATLNGSAIVAGSAGSGVHTGTMQSVPIQVGQRMNVLLSNGANFFDFVASTSGSGPYTVNFTKALPAAANSGARVWSTFGDLYATCGAQNYDLLNMTVVGTWGGVLVSCPTAGTVLAGTITNLNIGQGRMFGLVIGSGASANMASQINYTGGWTNVLNTTGNGSTTAFTANGERVFSGTNSASAVLVKVNGTTCAYSTGGTCPYTVSADGLTIHFNSAPGNGLAVSISERIFSAEGVTIDGTNTQTATTPSGNLLTQVQSGIADIPCLALNSNATSNAFTNSFCAPAGMYAFSADGVSGLDVNGLFALVGPVSLNIANGATVHGDVTIIPATTGAALATGYAGIPYTIDPSATFLGSIYNQNNPRLSLFSGAAGPTLNLGTALAASTSGSCTTGAIVVGQIAVPCTGGVTGTPTAGQVGTSVSFMLASTAIQGATGSGASTVITLTPPGITAASAGTTLNFAGPTQALGVSCAANSVTLLTEVVTGGVVTHC